MLQPPVLFQSTEFLNLLYTDLWWYYIAPGPHEEPPECEEPTEDGLQAHVYTANFGFEWFILSLQGTANYNPPGSPGDFGYARFQTWLNYKTGEIRYQYDVLRNEAATAEISLEDSLFFAGRQCCGQ